MTILLIITGVLLAVGVASGVMRLSYAVTYGALFVANILHGVNVLLLGGWLAWLAPINFVVAAGCGYLWHSATKRAAS